jgi:hypothetical protein
MSPDDPLTPAGRGGFGEFNGFSVRHYYTAKRAPIHFNPFEFSKNRLRRGDEQSELVIY